MNNQLNEKDQALWQTAEKRVSFKRHLITYLLVNAFLVAIWFFGSITNGSYKHFWPIWPILGWGIGIVFSYVDAYGKSKLLSTQKEFEKLKNNKK